MLASHVTTPRSVYAVILYAATVALLIAACSVSSDEQQVRAIIEAAELAAEARNTDDVLDLVTDDYVDAQGLDKRQLQQFLRAYFLTHPKIELAVSAGNIEFETVNRARVRVDIIVVGTRRSTVDSNTLSGDAEALQVELRRQESQWRVTRVDRIPK